MATTEERDIPDLRTLLTDIEGTIERLDKSPTSVDPMTCIKNDVLPLLRDMVASVGMALEDIQDLVEPVKLTGGEAEEVQALLQAYQSTVQVTNPALAERLQEAIGSLGLDEEDDEETEGETN